MSHSTVLVIGDNVDEQLARYDLNIEVAPYRVPYDFSDELAEARKWVATCPVDERPDLDDDVAVLRWYRGDDDVERNPDGGLVLVTTHNPIGEWDWYAVGGRWMGSILRVKPTVVPQLGEQLHMSGVPHPGYADICRKGDVDWEGTARDAAEDARRAWRATHAVIDQYPPVVPWPAFRERAKAGEITGEEAREQFRAQPAVAAAIATGVGGLYGEIDEYLVSEDQYACPAEAAAGVTAAVVKYGEWYRGCRWGADPGERDAWNRRFHELLENVPDDTLLTVVDCHS